MKLVDEKTRPFCGQSRCFFTPLLGNEYVNSGLLISARLHLVMTAALSERLLLIMIDAVSYLSRGKAVIYRCLLLLITGA